MNLMTCGLKAIQDLHASCARRYVFRRSVTHTCGHQDEPRVEVDVTDCKAVELGDSWVDAVGDEAEEKFAALAAVVCSRCAGEKGGDGR